MATVYIVFVQQGAGKTTYSRTLADQEQGACFSIDHLDGRVVWPGFAKSDKHLLDHGARPTL